MIEFTTIVVDDRQCGMHNWVARDVPGGKRILIVKINAQH